MLVPPVAKQVPLPRAHDGAIDEYQWLADRSDPDVVPLLEAENAYADAVLAPQQPLVEKIYGEIRDRTQETDLSAPYRYGDWWYYQRTVEGLSYPIHCRRADDDAPEQVILDLNELVDGHDYLELGAMQVSPDGRRLAYSVDCAGDEHYTRCT